MPPTRLPRGILDTSVVVDLDTVDASRLPNDAAITAITLAELAIGPHATSDPAERARRQERLQYIEAALDALPFDAASARAYGRVHEAVLTAGRAPRRRIMDLLIASTAVAQELPLFTRNAGDFAGLEGLLEVVEV